MADTQIDKSEAQQRTPSLPFAARGFTNLFERKRGVLDLPAPPTMLRMVPPPRSGEGCRISLHAIRHPIVLPRGPGPAATPADANAPRPKFSQAAPQNPSPERQG